MRRVFLTLVICLFSNMSALSEFNPTTSFVTEDVLRIPQTAEFAVGAIRTNSFSPGLASAQSFKSKFYAPWLTRGTGAFSSSQIIESFSLSYRDLDDCTLLSEFRREIGASSPELAREKIEAVKRNTRKCRAFEALGMVTTNSELRTLPLRAACNLTGPQSDVFQNSHLPIGTAVKVLLISGDGKWFFVVSSEESCGWILAQDVGLVPANRLGLELVTSTARQNLVAIKTDRAIVHTSGGQKRLKIGVFLPYVTQTEEEIIALLPERTSSGELIYSEIAISHTEGHMAPLPFTRANVLSTVHEFFTVDNYYSWGGAGYGRDCSSFTRDFFGLFGVHLARNSRFQSLNASARHVINVLGLSKEAKLDIIKRSAVPFRTLVYMPGHVAIYAGCYELQPGRVEPLILHNLWGLATNHRGSPGRNIINRNCLTTFQPGRELEFYDESRNLLGRVEKLLIY